MNRPSQVLRGAVAAIRERFSTLARQSERNVLLGTVLLASAVSAAMGFVLVQYYSVDILSSLVGFEEDCLLDWSMQLGRHCFSDYALPLTFGARPNPWEPYWLFLQPLQNNYAAAGMLPQLLFGLPAEWLGAPRLGLFAYLLVLTTAVFSPALWAARGARGLERVVVFVVCGAAAVSAWTVIDRGNSVGFVVPIALALLLGLHRQRWGLVAIMVVLAALVKPQFAILAVALFAARQWRLGGIAAVGAVLSNIAAYQLWPRDFPGTVAESIRNMLANGSNPGAFGGPYNVSFARGLMSLRYSIEKAWQTGSFADLGPGIMPPVGFLAGSRSLIGYAILVVVVVSVLALGQRIPPIMAGIVLLATASLFPAVTNQYYLVFVLPVAALVARDPDAPPGSGIFDRLATLGDRRRAVGICVSLAAALTIAAIAMPNLPIQAPHAGQQGYTAMVVTTTVLAPIAWLIACTAIIASYARRPAPVTSATCSSPARPIDAPDHSTRPPAVGEQMQRGVGRSRVGRRGDRISQIDASTMPSTRGGRGREIAIGGGIGGLIIVVVALFLGVGPTKPPNQQSVRQQVAPSLDQSRCKSGSDENKYVQCRVVAIGDSVDSVWSTLLNRYHPPGVRLFSGDTETGCGTATSEVGPFYCPVDQTAYFDTGFFQVLVDQFGVSGGPLAQEYVVAHVFGHHVQYVQGVLGRAQNTQGGRVRTELQADCYAGVWAHYAAITELESTGAPYLQPLNDKDIADALSAAASVDENRIKPPALPRVNPESWTHGSAEQREKWFTVGYQTGDPSRCDTFATNDLE